MAVWAAELLILACIQWCEEVRPSRTPRASSTRAAGGRRPARDCKVQQLAIKASRIVYKQAVRMESALGYENISTTFRDMVRATVEHDDHRGHQIMEDPLTSRHHGLSGYGVRAVIGYGHTPILCNWLRITPSAEIRIRKFAFGTGYLSRLYSYPDTIIESK